MWLALEVNFVKVQILIFSSWRLFFFDLKVLRENTLTYESKMRFVAKKFLDVMKSIFIRKVEIPNMAVTI